MEKKKKVRKSEKKLIRRADLSPLSLAARTFLPSISFARRMSAVITLRLLATTEHLGP